MSEEEHGQRFEAVTPPFFLEFANHAPIVVDEASRFGPVSDA